MPENEKQTNGEVFYQREIYKRGGIPRWYWDFKDEQVIKLISQTDQYIVDIGCGEGILLEKICKRFPLKNISGIDFMQENIVICQNYNLPVTRGDIYSIEIPDSSVDVVLLCEVIEHLVYPEKAIKEIYRILRPGGKLIILFPNDVFFAFTRFLTLKFKELFHDYGHVTKWTHHKLSKFLEPLGFHSTITKSTPFFFWNISLDGLMIAIKNKSL
jgi:ubiquinone/menaquinone biosynthesis C-methylase UbiE